MISGFQALCQARSSGWGSNPRKKGLYRYQGGFGIQCATNAPVEGRERERGEGAANKLLLAERLFGMSFIPAWFHLLTRIKNNQRPNLPDGLTVSVKDVCPSPKTSYVF
ncbi:hypothetical protein PoB_002919900 [Plakobranchus ocellatus]|uniref:Uncharacterized protein n=1 Tax=Plakobranchus ocellatus TaxID=259542 RepID=A0AAV4A8A1_9GAST|nr:hypothetical protein PoB_002919900 [Plakobranchus ocellatus]